MREGRLDGVVHRQAMLPVTIVEENPANLPLANSTDMPDAVAGQAAAANRQGVIEIQMAGAIMRFDGQADLATIRAVLGMLRT